MSTTLPTPPVSFVPFALSPRTGHAPVTETHPPTPALLPGQAAANDVRDDGAYARLVADPRVRKSIDNRLRHRINVKFLSISPDEKEEIVARVYESLWKRRTDRDPASTLPRIRGLARTIVDGKIVDFLRHRDTENEDLVDAPGEHDADLAKAGAEDMPNFVDELRPARPMTPERSLRATEQLEYLNEMAPKLGVTDDDIEVMYAMTYDRTGDERATWEELAAERKTTAGALRKRIERLQEALKEGWDRRMRRSLFLTLLLLAMLILFVLVALGPARNAPPPQPPPQPTVHQLAPRAPVEITTDAPPSGPEGDGKP